MGKIYKLPEKDLKQKMEDIIQKLRLDEPKVIGTTKDIETESILSLLQEIGNTDNFSHFTNLSEDEKRQ